MSNEISKPEFAICVRNDNHPASLELQKVYRMLPDPEAAGHKLVRVVDESGEDYLYPEDFFVRIELPRAAEALFSETS
jgi:hypothetical protein